MNTKEHQSGTTQLSRQLGSDACVASAPRPQTVREVRVGDEASPPHRSDEASLLQLADCIAPVKGCEMERGPASGYGLRWQAKRCRRCALPPHSKSRFGFIRVHSWLNRVSSARKDGGFWP